MNITVNDQKVENTYLITIPQMWIVIANVSII